MCAAPTHHRFADAKSKALRRAVMAACSSLSAENVTDGPQLHGVAMDGIAPEQHCRTAFANQVAGVARAMTRQIECTHAGNHIVDVTECCELIGSAVGGRARDAVSYIKRCTPVAASAR
jgi:hypothetical protein